MLRETGYTIRDACLALGISRSGYYYTLKQKIQDDKKEEKKMMAF
jgi:hypothetical protein